MGISVVCHGTGRVRAPGLFALAALAVAFSATTYAASLPAGFTERQVATGIADPTAMAFAPDGRLFVCQQNGRLRVIKNGTLLTNPFVTLTVNRDGERGLLGVAFDPQFASNHFVYVYYTATTPAIHNRLSRFTANGDVAVAGSELQLLNLPNLNAPFHNGGAIHFGPDGKLYVAVGENQNRDNAPLLSTPLGKILRINSDGSIPSDNPFFNQTTGINRAIWARGFRNPFTFSFERATARMRINDVGEGTREEINDGVAGSNYGWPQCEGTCSTTGLRDPIFTYGHGSSGTTGCAIVGSAFYNPVTVNFPASFVGSYFYGDFCSGWIRRLDSGNVSRAFATGISDLADIQTADDGTLWYLERGNGSVFQISAGDGTPRITVQPADQTVSVGQAATFSVSATGTAPLQFQWQRNGGNISGATSSSFTLASPTLADDGAMFRCVVTNSIGSATSNSATLHVTNNERPTATITTPANQTLYSAGNVISFAGTGTDPEDGVLPAANFTWQVDFHHAAPQPHVHPFVPPTSGITSGSFTIPNQNFETSAQVFFRILLTVRDSAGLSHQTFVDVVPRVVSLNLGANPTGLRVTLDSQPVTTPFSVDGVVGMQRGLGVVSPQTSGNQSFVFDSWSDGGAASHTIVTPTSDATFTANYKLSPCVSASAGAGFVNNAITSQAGTFTVTFDATPSVSPMDSVVALSNGPRTAHTGFATLVRFNTTGNIDARNGGAYAAVSTIPYAANMTYTFRLVVNVTNHTFAAYVKPPGGAEVVIGMNYAFRTEQNTVTRLNSWTIQTDAPNTGKLCNFAVQ
jgi:glucose/arabinose dehydrogenase